jgi:hypothetical protein
LIAAATYLRLRLRYQLVAAATYLAKPRFADSAVACLPLKNLSMKSVAQTRPEQRPVAIGRKLRTTPDPLGLEGLIRSFFERE